MAIKNGTEIKGIITNFNNGNLEIYVTDNKMYMVLPYKTIRDLRGAKINDLVRVVYDNKTKFIRCVIKITP
jgi:hypothetical protein